MKVLHVIPAVAARYGGPSQAVLQMCRALQSEGVEVLIAATDADGQSRLPVELEKLILYEGVPAIFFSRQWSEAFKYSRPLSRWLIKNVERFDVTHIHAVFSHSSLAAARACQRGGVPYIVRPLGSLDPWSLTQRKLEKQILWHLGVKRMLASAAAIHYTTVAEQHLAESNLGINSGVVVPLGVDQQAFQVTSEKFRERFPFLQGSHYVLVLSRLHPKKGLELLLGVFSSVTQGEKFKKWSLVIAGDGELAYVESLKRFVLTKDSANIIFTGWLDGVEKIEALRGAALLALPSYQENFAISVIEALASGVPALVSERVNLADEIREAGAGWVAPLSQEGLRAALEEAFRSDAERIRRGQQGQRLALSQYTWPAISGELVRLYRRISNSSEIS